MLTTSDTFDVMQPPNQALWAGREYRRKRQNLGGSFPRLGAEHHPLSLPQPYFWAPSGVRGGGGGAHAGLSLQFSRALGSSPWEQGVPS